MTTGKQLYRKTRPVSYLMLIGCFALLMSGIAFAAPLEPTAVAGVMATNTLPQLAPGFMHTCAVTASGGVKCWGSNSTGQVGDGTTTNRTTPVDVSGLTSGVQAVVIGYDHSCALTTTGGVKCWGGNSDGQLGNGMSNAYRATTPGDVTGLTSGVQALAANGNYVTCALLATGGVKCWGYNGEGELGDGTTTTRRTPVDVTGLTSGVQAIASGGGQTCALLTTGGVKCWGLNSAGQVGDGTTTNRTTPVNVSGLTSGVQAIATGWTHTCAVTTNGGVKCWGANNFGQIGNTTSGMFTTPVDVTTLTSGVKAVAAGGWYTCAVTTSNGVKCWGRNDLGQLGDGTLTVRLAPVNVVGLTSGVQAVATGICHTCAVTTSNGVKCWGRNDLGQVGDGTLTNRTTPIDVPGLGSVNVAGGFTHTCAVTSSGGVKCWGNNSTGQLGDGTTTNRTTPVAVGALTSGVQAVVSGYEHSCALTTSGGVKCWGGNGSGQLGNGASTMSSVTPVDVSGLTSGVLAIAANSYYFTCALTTSGGVKCWGANDYGLGDGVNTQSRTPVNVSGLTSGVQAITGGGGQICALTTGGGVKCWGTNSAGQLGDGTTTNRTTPVDVSGLTSGVQAIAAGWTHTCAVTTSGGVKCWGANNFGQIGDGTGATRLTPVDVTGLTSGVKAVATGGWFTCALLTNGGAKCWGRNDLGQLGDGTTAYTRLTAVNVSGLTSGVLTITTGWTHACAVTTSNSVKCWGNNANGQLGDATNTNRNVPTNIASNALGTLSVTDPMPAQASQLLYLPIIAAN